MLYLIVLKALTKPEFLDLKNVIVKNCWVEAVENVGGFPDVLDGGVQVECETLYVVTETIPFHLIQPCFWPNPSRRCSIKPKWKAKTLCEAQRNSSQEMCFCVMSHIWHKKVQMKL